MTPAGMTPVLYAPSQGMAMFSMEGGEVVSLPASMVPVAWIDGLFYASKDDIRAAQMEQAVAELRDGDSA